MLLSSEPRGLRAHSVLLQSAVLKSTHISNQVKLEALLAVVKVQYRKELIHNTSTLNPFGRELLYSDDLAGIK